MKRLSKRDKMVLIQVIKSCEKLDLNYNAAMNCINKLFDRYISRRTYYYYKHKMYCKLFGNNINERYLKNKKILKDKLRFLDLITIPNDSEKIPKYIEYQIISDYWVHNEFFGNNNLTQFYRKTISKTDSIIENSNKFLERIDNKKKSSMNNFSKIPSNATIRKEYVKCGKYSCYRCPHGPYFYAYWNGGNNGKGKLRKKYIGIYDPRQISTKN